MASFIKKEINNMNKIAIIVGALLTSFSVYADHLSIDDSNNWEFVDNKPALENSAGLQGFLDGAKYQKSLKKMLKGNDVVMQPKPNVLENQEAQIKMVEDFNNLLKRAKTKRSDAQLKIGDLLYVGNELACHEQEAVRWWKRACSNREPKACFRLGKYYFAANKKKSAHYFKMAGDYGHAESQMMVYISKKKENNVLIN